LYINGQEAGHLAVTGQLASGEVDPITGQPTAGTFQIGRSLDPLTAAASIKIRLTEQSINSKFTAELCPSGRREVNQSRFRD
jgi:hypothetical protein